LRLASLRASAASASGSSIRSKHRHAKAIHMVFDKHLSK